MLRLFSTVLKQLNNLVVVVNQDGEVAYVGPSVERILGYKAHELLGDQWWHKTCVNIANSEQRKLEMQHFFDQLTAGKNIIAPVEQKLNTAGGGSRWFSWNVSAGPKGSLVKIGYDITEKKQKELEILNRNTELFNRNREIFESLDYARNIQQAILPSSGRLKGNFSDAFALYQPKDVVSGDFYWTYSNDNISYTAVVDCTGHGVPGALMTMMANAMLKDVVIKRNITEPAQVLSALDEELAQIIHAQGNTVKAHDGMDVAFIRHDKVNQKVTFAGAFRPLILVSNGQLIEYSASHYPIGFYHDVVKNFEQQEISVKEGDMLYMFTDGYVDQFGGEQGKKFNKKNFKDLLLSMHDMEFAEQKGFLEYSLLNWRQKQLQTDDVLVMGLKI
jgi:PAS domain S-box-containing protein